MTEKVKVTTIVRIVDPGCHSDELFFKMMNDNWVCLNTGVEYTSRQVHDKVIATNEIKYTVLSKGDIIELNNNNSGISL